ncbi:MAG TPA: hypothetical protein VF296_01225 [Gallionella sp.]
MNTNKDEMRAEYRHEDLGKGLRGKYANQYAKGTNLALLKNLSLLHKTLPQTDSVIDALREDARY